MAGYIFLLLIILEGLLERVLRVCGSIRRKSVRRDVGGELSSFLLGPLTSTSNLVLCAAHLRDRRRQKEFCVTGFCLMYCYAVISQCLLSFVFTSACSRNFHPWAEFCCRLSPCGMKFWYEVIRQPNFSSLFKISPSNMAGP